MGCCDVYQFDGSLYYCYKGECIECREVRVQSRHCWRIYSLCLFLTLVWTSSSGYLQAALKNVQRMLAHYSHITCCQSTFKLDFRLCFHSIPAKKMTG